MAEGRPTGPIAAHLGPRYTLDVLREQEFHPEGDEPYLSRIRAFAVPALIGGKVVIQRDTELPGAIAHLLTERLPGGNWNSTEVNLKLSSKYLLARFRKYSIVHECLPAPEDLGTNQAMALEIYGELVSIDGQAGLQFRYDLETEVIGTMIVEIRAATYANVSCLGVNMPFYL